MIMDMFRYMIYRNLDGISDQLDYDANILFSHCRLDSTSFLWVTTEEELS